MCKFSVYFICKFSVYFMCKFSEFCARSGNFLCLVISRDSGGTNQKRQRDIPLRKQNSALWKTALMRKFPVYFMNYVQDTSSQFMCKFSSSIYFMCKFSKFSVYFSYHIMRNHVDKVKDLFDRNMIFNIFEDAAFQNFRNQRQQRYRSIIFHKLLVSFFIKQEQHQQVSNQMVPR